MFEFKAKISSLDYLVNGYGILDNEQEDEKLDKIKWEGPKNKESLIKKENMKPKNLTPKVVLMATK